MMEMVESLQLSLWITIGVMTLLSYVYELYTIFPGHVPELAKLTLQ